MVFVVAGSYQEFRDYANHQRKYNPKELTYLTTEEQLAGVTNPKFILTGKFYDAPIKPYMLRLPNARVYMTKTVAGEYLMAFRRLKEPDEVNGTEWQDKIYTTAFRLSPEAFVAVKFLTERIYNENSKELHEVVASLINLNQRN